MDQVPSRPTGRKVWGTTGVFVLAWIALALDNYPGIGRLTTGSDADFARNLSVALLLVVVVPLWWWVQARPRAAVPVLSFFVVAVALFTVSDSGVAGFPMAGVAALVITLRKGRGYGVAAVLVVVAWVFGTLVLFYPAGPTEVMVESVAVAVLMGLFVAFASLLRAVEHAREDAARAAADLSRANTELNRANAQLREAALVERDLALAEERARTSRELHDGLGHQLTLVKMSLEYAQRMRDRDQDTAWAEVANAVGSTQTMLDTMRRWVRALHPPPHLPDATGPAAFDMIADSFRGTGLEVRVRYEGMDDPPPLPIDVGLLAHRVVQEGLTNVLRHTDAREVVILMQQQPDGVSVTVRDDGTVDEDPGESFGRRNLRERAESLGGTVEGSTRPDGGFELVLSQPLPTTPAGRSAAGGRSEREGALP